MSAVSFRYGLPRVAFLTMTNEIHPLNSEPQRVGKIFKEYAKASAEWQKGQDEYKLVDGALFCYRFAGYITNKQGKEGKTHLLVDMFGSSKKTDAVRANCQKALDNLHQNGGDVYIKRAVELAGKKS